MMSDTRPIEGCADRGCPPVALRRRRAGVVNEPVEIVTITCSCGRRLYPEPGDTVRISLIQGPSGGGWRCVSHEYGHLCEVSHEYDHLCEISPSSPDHSNERAS